MRTYELALSNQTLITVLEGIDADVYVSDIETNEILLANKHIQESFSDELVGKTCYEVFRHNSAVCSHCKNRYLLDENNNPTGVHMWEDQNPVTERWYKNADRAIRWPDGRFVHVQIAIDITEQNQAVEAIRESEERMQRLASATHEGLGFSEGGIIFDANHQLAEILGYDVSELIGKHAMDFVAPESRSLVIERIKSGSEEPYEHLAMRKDRTIFPVEVQARMLENQGRQIRVTAVRDISNRKQAEEDIRAYQERFKVFFNSVNDAIFVHPLMEEGFTHFIEVNDVACHRYGYSREEFLKLKATDITLDTDVKEHSARENRDKLLKARHLVFETVHIKKSGETFPVEINANILEEHGQPVILAVVRDITERKQAEEKFKVVFDSAPDAHYIYDLNGKFVDGNEMVEEMLGYRKDKLVGKTYLELNFFLESQIPKITAILEKNILGKSTGPDEFTLIPKSGGKIEVEVVTHPVMIDGETLVLGIARDITERKQAELAVIESEERYRNIVEASLLGMHMYEFQSPDRLVFTGSNPAADTILGVDNSIFVGKTIEDAFPALADTEIPERYKSAAIKGTPWRAEQFNYDTDGIVGAFEVVAFQTSPNNMVAMFQDVTARKKAENELRTKTAELEALFSISAHLRTAHSADEMIPLVLAEMRRVLSSDAHGVIMLDANEKSFTYLLGDGTLAASTGVQFNIENSISGIVLKTRQPYITDDLSSDRNKTITMKGFQDLGPAAFVPVISESEFMGVLVCARTKTDRFHPYSPSEIQLLSAIGEMVGNAFRRATLYDQAMTRLQHVQALHSIDMAISANLDLSVILDVLLTQGTAQLDADAASLLLLNPHTHMLEFGAGSGFRKEEISSTRLRLGEGLPGQVAMDRKMLFLPDLSNAGSLTRKYLLDDGFVSYQAAPLIAKGQLQGVLEIFHRKAIVVRDEQADFLETLATQAAIAIDNSQLFSNLQRSNFELEMAYDATIEGWSRALELRDQETEGHTLRVTDMTLQLAQAMGVMSGDLIHIRRGALLHDIGKMGVPDHILLKPGKLNDAEWHIMRQHAVYAFEMLWPIEFLRFALDIPHYHHERWNGSGYPRGLKEEQIPLSARIFAVVDVWDALNNDRPYRKAWTEEKALDYITSNAGKLFDPHVVKHFLDFLKNNEQL
jgi:PAS domain S-box-containing protein/putative nucleotidyltransferase with HDIG domain